jgi:hypothetical protein
MSDEWVEISKAMSCGNCNKTTSVESKASCVKCGRMLCGNCGDLCKDHNWDEYPSGVGHENSDD